MLSPKGMPISGAVKQYAITTDGEGIVSCSCPAWKFQTKPIAARCCKHIEEVARLGAFQCPLPGTFAYRPPINRKLKEPVVQPRPVVQKNKPEWAEPF